MMSERKPLEEKPKAHASFDNKNVELITHCIMILVFIAGGFLFSYEIILMLFHSCR